MSEKRILVRLLRMYFPRNWEFDSALSKLRNFREGFEHPKSLPSLRHWVDGQECYIAGYLGKVITLLNIWTQCYLITYILLGS
jgi:hypothetical protein